MKKPPKRKPKHKRGHGPAVTPVAPARARSAKPAHGQAAATPAGGSGLPALLAGARSWLTTEPDRPSYRTAIDRHPQHPVGRPMARTAVYAPDERQAMLLLLLPFLFMAAAIGINQSLRYAAGERGIAATKPVTTSPRDRVVTEARPAQPTPAEQRAAAIRATPRADVAAVAAPRALLSEAHPTADANVVRADPPLAAVVAPSTTVAAVDTSTALPRASAPAGPADLAGVSTQPPLTSPSAAPPTALAPARDAAIVVAALPPVSASVAHAAPPSATLTPTEARPPVSESIAASGGGVLALPPSALAPPLAGLELPLDGDASARHATHFPPGGICPAPAGWGVHKVAAVTPALSLAAPASLDPAAFGQALASAARGQLSELVVYTDRYRRIAYPMGDVSQLYGVCTDVVIRAYRSLGLDLQALVHQTRVGSGDTSIDHRRVETLRRFFAIHGQSIPVTDFAEDYRPGDVVSYYRPQNAHSRSHIALVSDVVGPSGRLMIIHNRGWGPQLEDGLFVDEITGHYRYAGPKQPAGPPLVATTPAETGAAAHAAGAAPASLRQTRNTGGIRHKATARRPAAAETAPSAAPATPPVQPRRREARSAALAVAR